MSLRFHGAVPGSHGIRIILRREEEITPPGIM